MENRPRRSHYQGPLLIHASASKPDARAIAEVRQMVAELYGDALSVPDSFATGELIGLVEMTDCVKGARSPWAQRGSFHLKLASARAVAPGTQLTGQLGIWSWTVGTVSHGWSKKSARVEPVDAKAEAEPAPAATGRSRRWPIGVATPKYPAIFVPLAKGIARKFG